MWFCNLFLSACCQHLCKPVYPLLPSPPHHHFRCFPPLSSQLTLEGQTRTEQRSPWAEGISGCLDIQRLERVNTKYSSSLRQISPWISAVHQKIQRAPGTLLGSRDTVSLCLPLLFSPLLPKQTLISHLKIYAPNAYINIPIDLPLVGHYQDLFIPPAPHRLRKAVFPVVNQF